MKEAVCVVDMQHDFVDPDGALYVPGAENLIKKIYDFYDDESVKDTIIFYTQDLHNGEEPEMMKNGGPFPEHCMFDEGGSNIVVDIVGGYTPIFTKRCYDVFDKTLGNPYIEPWLKQQKFDLIHVVGVVGNICVEAAALGFRRLGIETVIHNEMVAWLNVGPENNEEVSRKKLLKAGVKFV